MNYCSSSYYGSTWIFTVWLKVTLWQLFSGSLGLLQQPYLWLHTLPDFQGNLKTVGDPSLKVCEYINKCIQIFKIIILQTNKNTVRRTVKTINQSSFACDFVAAKKYYANGMCSQAAGVTKLQPQMTFSDLLDFFCMIV